MDVMELFKPDIFFAIADSRTSLSEGIKRIGKSVDRTCSMLDKCVSRYKGSKVLKLQSSLIGKYLSFLQFFYAKKQCSATQTCGFVHVIDIYNRTNLLIFLNNSHQILLNYLQ